MCSASGMRKGRRRARHASVFTPRRVFFSPERAGLNIEREGTGSFSTRMPPVAPSDRPTIKRRLAPEKNIVQFIQINLDYYRTSSGTARCDRARQHGT